MGLLRSRDALLLWTLLGVWGVCFLLHLSVLLGGGLAWIPFHVEAAAGPEAGPRVRSFWSAVEADRSSLRVGDELVEVGGRSLAGVGKAAFVADVYGTLDAGAAGSAPSVEVRYRREGAEAQARIELLPVRWPWRATLLSLCFAATGALAFVRSRGLRAARLFFVGMIGYALHWTYFFGGSRLQTYAAIVVFAGGLAVTIPFVLRTLLVFPAETAREGRFWRIAPAVFLVLGPAASSWAFGLPFPSEWGLPLNLLASIGSIACGGVLLVANFRASRATGKRQIKWVVLGFYVGLVPALLAGLVTLVRPEFWWLYELSLLAVVLVPISIWIALSYDNLFDVNGLITRATSFTLLSIALIGATLFAIPRAADSLEAVLDPTIAQATLSLLAAGLLLFTRSTIEPRLADLLFVERRAFERGVRELWSEMSRCEKPADLFDHLGRRLRQLLDPVCTTIYAPADAVLAPVFADGPAFAPAFALESPLVQTLELFAGPLSSRRLRRRGVASLGEAEAAALDAMGVEMLVPVLSDGQIGALICLGEKRSGDVFTDTEVVLLGTVADHAALQLQRFDQDQLVRDEREMMDRMRKFVPGAVREQLERGVDLEPGSREVTVLFADIQGYTRFSEARQPGEIFSTISDYTARVSELVRAEGGAVVDFSGDGLMAVFGASGPLADKERAALRAARRIGPAVRQLGRRAGGEGGLEVGVGVATGEGFVGTIRSIDRDIWCVLGNTTNLAARLEGLTRDLAAQIVIDETTAARCRGEIDDFQSLGPRPVRGRSAPIELHVLARERARGDEPFQGGP